MVARVDVGSRVEKGTGDRTQARRAARSKTKVCQGLGWCRRRRLRNARRHARAGVRQPYLDMPTRRATSDQWQRGDGSINRSWAFLKHASLLPSCPVRAASPRPASFRSCCLLLPPLFLALPLPHAADCHHHIHHDAATLRHRGRRGTKSHHGSIRAPPSCADLHGPRWRTTANRRLASPSRFYRVFAVSRLPGGAIDPRTRYRHVHLRPSATAYSRCRTETPPWPAGHLAELPECRQARDGARLS